MKSCRATGDGTPMERPVPFGRAEFYHVMDDFLAEKTLLLALRPPRSSSSSRSKLLENVFTRTFSKRARYGHSSTAARQLVYTATTSVYKKRKKRQVQFTYAVVSTATRQFSNGLYWNVGS
jgi:hypothetical protein